MQCTTQDCDNEVQVALSTLCWPCLMTFAKTAETDVDPEQPESTEKENR